MAPFGAGNLPAQANSRQDQELRDLFLLVFPSLPWHLLADTQLMHTCNVLVRAMFLLFLSGVLHCVTHDVDRHDQNETDGDQAEYADVGRE
jgi:hypothetical protein